MHGTIAHAVLISIVAISVLLMLARPRNVPEVYWVGAGAILLVALRLMPLRLAGHAIAKGMDVCFFLIGMMLLSELAKEHGVFDWLSSAAVRGSRGSASRLFALIYAIGAAVTICLSNDATAVVLTPAVLAAVRKSKARPLPHLFACAMIANAASFVLPISNPANLVVFHTGMPPLGRWLLSFLVPSLFSIGVTYAVLRWHFRAELRGTIHVEDTFVPLSGNGKLVLFGLAAEVTVLLAASALGRDLGLPTCLAAFAITAVVSFRAKVNPLRLWSEVSWSTLALVAGLFVMVEAIESIGALQLTQSAVIRVQEMTPALGALLASVVVGVGNNVVNNLPLGLIAGATLQATHAPTLLTSAVLIGVDLGPNLSVTGSLATVLWLIALRKENVNVSFRDFLKVGVLAMPAALLASIASAIVMNLLTNT